MQTLQVHKLQSMVLNTVMNAHLTEHKSWALNKFSCDWTKGPVVGLAVFGMLKFGGLWCVVHRCLLQAQKVPLSLSTACQQKVHTLQ